MQILRAHLRPPLLEAWQAQLSSLVSTISVGHAVAHSKFVVNLWIAGFRGIHIGSGILRLHVYGAFRQDFLHHRGLLTLFPPQTAPTRNRESHIGQKYQVFPLDWREQWYSCVNGIDIVIQPLRLGVSGQRRRWPGRVFLHAGLCPLSAQAATRA